MGNISDLFLHLREHKTRYLNSAKGGEFEDRINTKLHKLGFSRIIKDDIEEEGFKLLKELVLDRETEQNIRNPFTFDKHFITQPYGQQNYPDFLILDGQRVINIEVKFSKGKQGKPVWNSGLPRPNGIYIFGAYGRNDLTFFAGRDVVPPPDARNLHDFFDKGLKEYQRRFNEDEMGKQPYGFSAYIRKAFDQSKSHNPEAVTDFFSNPNRNFLESSVIDYLRQAPN